jgi:hypothetical protein
MIESHQLDETIIRFENDAKHIDKLLDHIQDEQSLLLDILVGSHAELLTEEEMDYLLFLFLGIYGTFQKVSEIPVFNEQEISKAEEFSWKILNEHNDYQKAMDTYFEVIKETEVMDFIDLSIAADDENDIKITDPGRLIILAVLVALTKLMEDSQIK